MMKRIVGRMVWKVTTYLGIPLGNNAYKIFGWMINREGIRVKEPTNGVYRAGDI